MEQTRPKTNKAFKLNITGLDDFDVECEGDDLVALQQLLDTITELNRQKCQQREAQENRQQKTDVIINIGIVCSLLFGVFIFTTAISAVITTVTGVHNVR